MKLNFLLTLLCILISEICCSKILMVFPLPSRSHFILGRRLAAGLVGAGHDVTFVSNFTEKPPDGNGTFRSISVPNCHPHTNVKTGGQLNPFDIEKLNPIMGLPFMNFFGADCVKTAFESDNIQSLLKSNEKFDAVVVENLYTEGLAAFACYYNVPLVILSPVGKSQWINDAVGGVTPPSYIPTPLLPFTDKMNFWQKSQNYLMSILTSLNHKFFVYPKHDELVQKYFSHCPPVQEMTMNAALILSNSHESISPAAPKVPNIIDIGGYHITRTRKNLPADLQKILDNAKNGVVYFSLGSHIKPSMLSLEIKTHLVKVLGSLKQTVLWKWDDENFPRADNIVIRDWFPQQEILAHPNVKLFITHGGLLSMSETIYLGVPILAIPVLGDQKFNALRARELGIGEPLFFSQINEETLRSVLNDLLTNPKYTENVKHRSTLFRDRLNHPLDVAVYWIEYVIRHNGAPHLRVAGRELTWFQYYSLDVILVWSVILFSPVFLCYILLKKICCKSGKNRKISEKIKKS